MRIYSRIIALILCTILLSLSATASNIEFNIAYTEFAEETKQYEIDSICDELNALAMQKYKAQNKNTNYASNEVQLRDIDSEEALLDKRLQELGLEKMDANNIADMQRLADLLKPTLSNYESITGTSVDYSDIDDYVRRLSTCFTVYLYDGTRTRYGETYSYAYIRVIDNLGQYKYTKSLSNVNMLNYTPDVVGDLLSYNFEYCLEAATGSLMTLVEEWFKNGFLIEWGIGNAFTLYNSLDPSAAITTSSALGNIYSATMMSVTQMTYYFVYVSPEWVLAGSRANNVEFSITETIKANINGSIRSETRDSNRSFNTGYSWSWYIDNFIDTGRDTHHEIDSLVLYCMDRRVFTFDPIYCRGPLQGLA